MPSSNHSSSDSPPPSATSSDNDGDGDRARAKERAKPFAWRTNLWLFLATAASVFFTGMATDRAPLMSREAVLHGAEFAGALLTILLAHEFGHYIAARIHKVDASLPFFIPMPMLSPFGTMGAFIRMRGVIPTRAALLDIGASGPLAGLALAIPMYLWGVAHSTIVTASVGAEGSIQLGESLLLKVLDTLGAPAVPAGMDIELSPVAFAGWAGMFVTMINLIPVAQLDGGHVAYALFGPRQNRIAQWVHRSMLAFFFVSLAMYTMRDVRAGFGFVRIGTHVNNSLFWLMWFEVVAVLGSLSAPARADGEQRVLTTRTRIIAVVGLVIIAGIGRDKSAPLLWVAWFLSLGVLLAMELRWGVLRPSTLLDHPTTGEARLGVGRAAIAIVSLLLFAALFMPTPIAL
jgi:membrane-associated protease RseP (regulator of RpoE activity)